MGGVFYCNKVSSIIDFVGKIINIVNQIAMRVVILPLQVISYAI